MFTKIIVTSFIGALFNLDNSILANIMISRPIVVAPLLGLVLGDLKLGIEIGLLFEFLFADVLYAGTAVPINVTLLTTLVLGCANFLPHYGDALLMFIIFLSLPMVYIFRQIELGVRLFNSLIVNNLEEKIKKANYFAVYASMFYSICIFFFINFILLFVCIFLTSEIAKILFFKLPDNIIYTLDLTYSVLPILGLAVVFNIFFHDNLLDYIKKIFDIKKVKDI